MKLHDLKPTPGSRRSRQRVGRGIGAGQGKTSGRGQKGAGARSGAKTPRAFEGGQMRMTQRIPHLRGFTNKWRREYVVVNLGKLNRFDSGSIVDGAALAGVGLVAHQSDAVKLLAAGRVEVSVTVRVAKASAAAIRAVEAAGGRVELLEPAAASADADVERSEGEGGTEPVV